MELTIIDLSLKIFCVILNRQNINLSSHHVARKNRAPFYNIMESPWLMMYVSVCARVCKCVNIIIETFFK